jgi:hypothetical protein
MGTDYYIFRCDEATPAAPVTMGDVQSVREAISRSSSGFRWSEDDPIRGGWVATDGYLIELRFQIDPEGQVSSIAISPYGPTLGDVGRCMRELCDANGWRAFDPQWGKWIEATDWADYGA